MSETSRPDGVDWMLARIGCVLIAAGAASGAIIVPVLLAGGGP